jgi:Arc/MetJ-type ribon-helix-helix transcriptional regulator
VREGRFANRSQATQAALDLLDRRNALPTLDSEQMDEITAGFRQLVEDRAASR